MYTKILDEHVPLKTIKVRQNQVPYMNKELRKATSNRKRLWRKYKASKSLEDWERYRKQRNLTVNLRRRSVKRYFNDKFYKSTNPAEFWKTWRPFLHSKNIKNHSEINLPEDDKMVERRCDAAEILNNYFVHIADEQSKASNEDMQFDVLRSSMRTCPK